MAGRPPGRQNNKTIARAAEVQKQLAAEINPSVTKQPKQASMVSPVKPPKPVKVDTPKTTAQQYLEEESDMLYVPPEIVPPGMRYNWKTFSVLGQPQARRYGRFQMTGWEPVPAERHPGMWTPKGYKGNIEMDGLVLMEKSEEACQAHEAREERKALAQVQAKEQQLRGGNLDGVTMDTQHRSVHNKVGKSYERLDVPKE
jgi:hypothetical protein